MPDVLRTAHTPAVFLLVSNENTFELRVEYCTSERTPRGTRTNSEHTHTNSQSIMIAIAIVVTHRSSDRSRGPCYLTWLVQFLVCIIHPPTHIYSPPPPTHTQTARQLSANVRRSRCARSATRTQTTMSKTRHAFPVKELNTTNKKDGSRCCGCAHQSEER